jgi:outer membrane murein-binding lipoprotein Lpp
LPQPGEAAQWQAVTAFAKQLAEQLTTLSAFAAGLRAEVAIARQDYSIAKREAEQALQADDRTHAGFYQLALGQSSNSQYGKKLFKS